MCERERAQQQHSIDSGVGFVFLYFFINVYVQKREAQEAKYIYIDHFVPPHYIYTRRGGGGGRWSREEKTTNTKNQDKQPAGGKKQKGRERDEIGGGRKYLKNQSKSKKHKEAKAKRHKKTNKEQRADEGERGGKRERDVPRGLAALRQAVLFLSI